MLPLATPSTESRGAGLWQTLGRHQLGATIAGGADFGAMIFCVEALGRSPVTATAIGATLGALTNFCLGRAWIFRRASGRPVAQAVRYAAVSAASAAWNALGEHLLHDVARVQYVLARALVAIAVSLFWNFPVQRRFVFREVRAK
ncbi:MAG TPA: GtrA family protein [Polyangiaceae bacterium]|nr:GtrA family protein [Polyangiaceae bacterium]